MSDLNKDHYRGRQELKGQIISIAVLALLLITIWYMLDLVLLTFIITFILYHIVCKMQEGFRKISRHGLPAVAVLLMVYILFFVLITIIGVELVPRVILQVTDISHAITHFDYNKLIDSLDPRVTKFVGNLDVNQYISNMGLVITDAATKVGQFSINIFLALILSFVLVAEKDQIKQFGERMGSSKVSFVYKYFIDFGGIFARTFGKVMKVQVTIAFVNAILSAIMLLVLGFPSVIGLSFMIFCLGLIPVAGVIVSLIPLSIIAFTIGGFVKVVQVIIMIIVIHAIEAYILNPKLMANKTRLPVCFVFIVLLVGEHYLGVWGLLIGVPIFIFLLTILDVDYATEKKTKFKRKSH